MDNCHVLSALKTFCQNHPASCYVIGYSGGVDSHVLLHAFSRLIQQNPAIQCRAIHVNHQLQAHAPDWATHCLHTAQAYQIPIKILTVDCDIQIGESIEKKARDKRYSAIIDNMQDHELLACAHHQDDQAETLLLQLCRGSGLKGCAAMGSYKVLAPNKALGRPLLDVTREQIIAYAKAHQLSWIEDSSNQNLSFSRNFIRHQVLPLLGEHFGDVKRTLHRSAELFAQSQAYIESQLHDKLDAFLCQDNKGLVLEKLQSKSAFEQSELIRAFILFHGYPLPSQKKCKDIQQQLFYAKQDANIAIDFEGAIISRYQGVAYLVQEHQPLIMEDTHWQDLSPLALNNGMLLSAKQACGKGLKMPPKGTQIRVRARDGGEKCKPQGALHHKSLKKWLQVYQIPPWERARLPLVYFNEQLVAVGDLFICHGWAAQEGENGLILDISSQSA